MLGNSPRIVAVIAAVAENGVIGSNGSVPWQLAADLRRFRLITSGHTVIMGRKTWDSLKAPLPGRENIVVTGQVNFCPQGARTERSLHQAIGIASYPDPIFVIGGERLYAEAMEFAQQLYVTEIKRAFDGDVFFPRIEPSIWRETDREDHAAPDPAGLFFDFVSYQRRSRSPFETAR